MRFLLAVVLAGCSSLDPSVGPLHVEKTGSGVDTEVPDAETPDADGADVSVPDDATTTDAVTDAPASTAMDADARAPMTGVSFRRDIRPLINRAQNDPMGKGCKNCHYSTEVNHQGIDLGGFDMATLREIREGGGSTGRRIIVAGKPEESGLIQKLRGTYPYGTRMPKNGPAFWSDADIKTVADWIAQGAKGADDE